MTTSSTPTSSSIPGTSAAGSAGFLLGWVEAECAPPWLADRPDGRSRRRSRRARPLIEARGFVLVRHFYRMLIDLDGAAARARLAGRLRGLAASSPARSQLLHAVIEEAFADHWGHEPQRPRRLAAHGVRLDWWDPSLVYLVREGDEVVAAAINAVRFGVGWIGTLGHAQAWRGRGLGRRSCCSAFGELYRRGERRIGLGVDAGNETGATHLYESVGMRVAWQADVYERFRHVARSASS